MYLRLQNTIPLKISSRYRPTVTQHSLLRAGGLNPLAATDKRRQSVDFAIAQFV